MLLLAMAVTSGLMSSPELLNGSEVVTPDDYPKQMLEDNRSAFEDLRVVVGTSGKPEKCDVIGEVQGNKNIGGNNAIRQLSCRLMIRRAKFRPAYDIDGQPTYGTFSGWIAWQSGDGLFQPGPNQVDAEISVSFLPKGVTDPALVAVDVAVAIDGTPKACVAAPKEKYATLPHIISPMLAGVACSQFTSSGKLNPAHNQLGEAVPSVQRLVARFSTSAVADKTPSSSR